MFLYQLKTNLSANIKQLYIQIIISHRVIPADLMLPCLMSIRYRFTAFRVEFKICDKFRHLRAFIFLNNKEISLSCQFFVLFFNMRQFVIGHSEGFICRLWAFNTQLSMCTGERANGWNKRFQILVANFAVVHKVQVRGIGYNGI